MEDALRRHAPADALPWERSGPFEQAVERERGDRRRAALRRVQLGAEIEASLAARCERECPVRERAASEPSAGACQLYFDAYAAAIWTSAHAEYVVALDAGCEEPAAPSVGSFPCAASGVDLSDLFARRANPKEAGVPKAAEPLVQLMGRCTNPGSRGWDSVLEAALEVDGVRATVHDLVKVCLTGMHPQLHPSARATWDQRLVILRVAQALLADRPDVVKAAAHVKEAVRRALASTLACDAATHAALASFGHPVRHLHQPPVQMPHAGMEAAMVAFARAGRTLASESGAERKLSVALRRAFVAPDGCPPHEPAWEPSWLGAPPRVRVRGRVGANPRPHPNAGKGTADVHARQPLVALASDVWSAAFKAHFIAFWLFAQSHQLRATRLDSAQHAAVHGLNAATRLVSQLDEEEALAAQRAALRDPSAGILTIGEAAERLGLADPPVATAPNGGARSPAEGAQLLATCGAESAARLLCYARVAWLSEEMLTVDLGPRTTALQLAALQRRFRVDTPEALPMHATHVCACTECKRVANAHVTAPSSIAFNEIGSLATQTLTTTLVPHTRVLAVRRRLLVPDRDRVPVVRGRTAAALREALVGRAAHGARVRVRDEAAAGRGRPDRPRGHHAADRAATRAERRQRHRLARAARREERARAAPRRGRVRRAPDDRRAGARSRRAHLQGLVRAVLVLRRARARAAAPAPVRRRAVLPPVRPEHAAGGAGRAVGVGQAERRAGQGVPLLRRRVAGQRERLEGGQGAARRGWAERGAAAAAAPRLVLPAALSRLGAAGAPRHADALHPVAPGAQRQADLWRRREQLGNGNQVQGEAQDSETQAQAPIITRTRAPV